METIMSKKIVFRTGYKAPKGLSAVKVKEELDKIESKFGQLTPELVLQVAQSARNPLHKAFVWDDTKAAEEYRKIQARTLIRAVWVVPSKTKPAEPSFAYVPNPAEKYHKGGYKAIVKIASDEELFQLAYKHLADKMQAAIDALNALEQAARKVGDPERKLVVAKIVNAVNAANKAVGKLKGKAV
jgi:hypothetical protein